MSNVLGTLFGDIANAIRVKTGDTATMKPAEFPDKIAAIESGGSGGGGSLPAGIYLSSSDVFLKPNNYTQKRFMYNGELYAATGNLQAAGYLYYIYKWNGSAWEQIVSVTDCTMDSAAWYGVEYNGNFHMIDNKQHYVFDGATLTASTSCTGAYSKPFVWQGKLCVYDESYKAYEWDDDASTWTQFATLSYRAVYPLVYNDELYFTASSRVSKYENGSLTQVATPPKSTNSPYRVVNGEVYACYDHSYYTIWYRLNMETMEYTEIGKHQRFRVMRMTENADELSFVGTTYVSPNNYFPFFVINIVEATE